MRVVFDAVLERSGLRCGIDWLDVTGTDGVVVRLSRGAGLPARLPDLLGLAVRIPGERPVDHAPPGLPVDGPLARLRRPAYAAARAARGVLLEAASG